MYNETLADTAIKIVYFQNFFSQNAHDWVWLGKANNSSGKKSEDGSSSQARMSYEGSEMNITANPRTDDFTLEEHRDPLVGSTTNTNTSRSRTRTMASGHLPPPGHPAHGAPPFQISPDMLRFGPYQKSHRYHQQMLMHRPQRFLPAPPMQQRLSPVYQNNNNNMAMSNNFELEQMQQQQRLLDLAKQEERMLYPDDVTLMRRFNNDTNIIQNPMESDRIRPRSAGRIDLEEENSRRPRINTSTYTKKNPGLAYFDGEYDKEKLILPVGYPYYGNTGNTSQQVIQMTHGLKQYT